MDTAMVIEADIMNNLITSENHEMTPEMNSKPSVKSER